ncbi:hypothetical protein [Pseudomonas sp. MWU13-2100]|uniref:hypothetical protein n=1 Tax=Pseudomonas sp. MWU13-2100 TaxID=2935075 RepID=UPI00200C0800|nr:hypothetical protein [Pseudomonas sp. MWU13-2100]
MSITTPIMQHVFSTAEYKARCQHAETTYRKTIESPDRVGNVGGIVEFVSNTVAEGVEMYHQKRCEGFIPLDLMKAEAITVVSGFPSYMKIRMHKTEEAQQADLAIIFDQVRTQYQTDIDVALECHLVEQVAMMVANEEKARIEAEAKRITKLEATKRKELLAARDKLKAQLIAEGKLTEEGVAQ